MKIRLLDTVHVDQNEIGPFPRFQSAYLVFEERDFRAVHSVQFEYLMRSRRPGRYARFTMNLLSQAHLLDDVVIVVDACFIDSNSDGDVPVHQSIYRRDAALETQV